MKPYKLFFTFLLALALSACHSTKKPIAKKRMPRTPKHSISKSNTHDASLYSFVKDWEGTPHKMGGTSKKGVDCSGFVINVYKEVYGDPFKNRRARDLYLETIPIKRKELKEGDLVFFKINKKTINHVGVYLKDGKFAHVSSKRGVMVSSLNEAYFHKYFYAGGRKK
jgi:lipoprotein Spr